MGIIDSDDMGEVIIITVSTLCTFKKGEYIAQLFHLPFVIPGHIVQKLEVLIALTPYQLLQIP